MNHQATQQLHLGGQVDPPIQIVRSPWELRGITERLEELWKNRSAREIADILNTEFNAGLTRNSIVGKLARLKLTVSDKIEISKRTRRAKRTDIPATPRPKLRIVAANGNSNRQRVIRTVETDLPALRCVAVASRHLTILEVGANECRYPDEGGGEFRCCGAVTVADSSYCLAHKQLVYVPATPRNEKVRGRR